MKKSSENTKYTVSVIIPVYKVENTIKRFLDKTQKITLSNTELIFIDDASPDGSIRIVEEYAKDDSRIRILRNKDNIGQGRSRNRGISFARGEYLSFMDPDDWPDPDFLSILYHRAKEKNCDIVKGRTQYDRVDGSVAVRPERCDIIRDNIDIFPLYMLFNCQMHSALYRRDYISSNGIEFGSPRKAQDTTFLLKACAYPCSFDIAEKAVYHHCEREGSILHTLNPFMLQEHLKSIKDKISFLSDHLHEDRFAWLYVLEDMRYFLSFHTYVAASVNSDEDAKNAAYVLREARRLLMSIPYRDRIINADATMHALAATGENISEFPFSLLWHEPLPAQWLETAERWSDFAHRHPVYSSKYLSTIRNVFNRARRKSDDSSYVNKLNKLWNGLPGAWKKNDRCT